MINCSLSRLDFHQPASANPDVGSVHNEPTKMLRSSDHFDFDPPAGAPAAEECRHKSSTR
jgi:hypothetical protein